MAAPSLLPGSLGEARRRVDEDMTALAFRSGEVPVLATPALLALIEEAAVVAVRAGLQEGTTSVGTYVELEHLAAASVGAEIVATARLTEIEGRRLTFECEAYDGSVLVGRARHVRAVVRRDRYEA